MLKFFRKIRKNLLSEGKTTKYFKYAIGEIILVVIGILIALQINNWNEAKKERATEIQLLKSVSSDIKLDILQLENNIINSDKRLEELRNILNSLKKPELFDKNIFIQGAFNFVVDNYFICNSGVFDEAVSSGKMRLIANENLNKKIFDYYRIAKLSIMDATTKQSTDEVLSPIFIETIALNKNGFDSFEIDTKDISTLNEFDMEKLKNNKDFWRMVMIKFGITREQTKTWSTIKESASELKDSIDLEIELLTQ